MYNILSIESKLFAFILNIESFSDQTAGQKTKWIDIPIIYSLSAEKQDWRLFEDI